MSRKKMKKRKAAFYQNFHTKKDTLRLRMSLRFCVNDLFQQCFFQIKIQFTINSRKKFETRSRSYQGQFKFMTENCAAKHRFIEMNGARSRALNLNFEIQICIAFSQHCLFSFFKQRCQKILEWVNNWLRFFIAAWFECYQSVVIVQRTFQEKSGKNMKLPVHNTIKSIHAKLTKSGEAEERPSSYRTVESIGHVSIDIL